MSAMSFQLVLELQDKATAALDKLAKAEKAQDAANKASVEAAVAGSKKAEQAIAAQARAAEIAAKAYKNADVAARAQAAAAQASAKQGEAAAKAQAAAQSAAQSAARETTRQTEAAAAAQANAARQTSMVTAAMKAMRAAASGAGSVAAGAFQRLAHAAGGAARAAAQAGRSAGRDFARGVADAIKAERGAIGAALRGAWSRATGYEWMGGPGGMRANVGSAVSRGRQFVSQGTAQAFSNVQGAFNVEEALRPDLGAEGARAWRQAADQALPRSPFSRDQMRAALPSAVQANVMPGSRAWQALSDAAASQGVDPAQAVAAYAAMKRGDYGQLEQFGIKVGKGEGEDAGASNISFDHGGSTQTLPVEGNLEQMVLTALERRFGGAGERKAASVEGVMNRAGNAFDAFIGKVMDAGPYQFVNEQFEKLLQTAGGPESAQAAAQKLGSDLTEALKAGRDAAVEIYQALSSVASAVSPIVEKFGGWKTVLEAIAALSFANWVMQLLAPLAMLVPALISVTTAAWGFTAALAANPVTWIVAGLVALAAAAYLVYRNWEQIGPMLSGVWDGVKSAADAAWQGVKGAASDAWASVSTAVSSGAAAVRKAAGQAWEGLKQSASDAWTGLSDVLSNALAAVTKAVTAWGTTILGAMKAAFQPVQEWFGTAVSAIGTAWEKVSGAVKGAAAYVGIGNPEDPEAAKRRQNIADAGQASAAIAKLDDLQTKLAAAQQAVQNFDLASPIAAAVNAGRAAITGVSFHAEGVAMMRTLAAGIEAGAAQATAAVARVTQKLRDYLPHSPAKEGALADLDRVRFSETLADAIRPEPAIAAVRAVSAGMRGAIADPEIGVMARMSGGVGGVAAAGGQSGGPTQIAVHYAPTLNASGGDARGFREQLREHAYELAEIVQGRLRQDARLNFRDA